MALQSYPWGKKKEKVGEFKITGFFFSVNYVISCLRWGKLLIFQ